MEVSPSAKQLFDWIVAGEDHGGREQGRAQRDSVETARSKALDLAREEDHRFLSPQIHDPEKSRDPQELHFATRIKNVCYMFLACTTGHLPFVMSHTALSPPQQVGA